MGILPVAGQFPTVLAAVILAIDRKIARRLREAGAINAAHAIEFDPPGPVGRARLRRMLSVGAVRETGANRYYLDETGFRTWRVVRRRRALVILAFMVVLIAILIVAGVVKVR
jgi:hypothetical protein